MAAAWPSGDRGPAEGVQVSRWMSRRAGLEHGARSFLPWVSSVWGLWFVFSSIRGLSLT